MLYRIAMYVYGKTFEGENFHGFCDSYSTATAFR